MNRLPRLIEKASARYKRKKEGNAKIKFSFGGKYKWLEQAQK